MKKHSLFALGLICVLSFGLISCRKDDKKESQSAEAPPPAPPTPTPAPKDDFRAPTPVIVDGDGQKKDLAQFDLVINRELDINDAIDISAAQYKELEVDTDCGGPARTKFKFQNVKKLRVFEILPSEILADDLTTQPARCVVQFHFTNELGSVHHFPPTNTDVRDAGRSEMVFEGAERKFQVSAIPNIRVRYNNSELAQAQIVCADAKLPEQTFVSVAELSDFDFRRPELYEGRDANQLLRYPFQLCRLRVRQADRLVALSSLFTLQFPTPSLQISVDEPFASLDSPDELARARTEVAKEVKTTATIKIRNPLPIEQNIQFPLGPFAIRIMDVYTDGLGYSDETTSKGMIALRAGTPVTATSGNTVTVQIPAGGEIAMDWSYRQAKFCIPGAMIGYYGQAMDPLEEIPMKTFDDAGNVTASGNFPKLKRAYFSDQHMLETVNFGLAGCPL